MNSFRVTVTMTSVNEPKCWIVSKMNSWPRPPSRAYASKGARDDGCDMMNEAVDRTAGGASETVGAGANGRSRVASG